MKDKRLMEILSDYGDHSCYDVEDVAESILKEYVRKDEVKVDWDKVKRILERFPTDLTDYHLNAMANSIVASDVITFGDKP